MSGAALQGRGPRGGCLHWGVPRSLLASADFRKRHVRLRLDRVGFQPWVRGTLGPIPDPSFAHLLRTEWGQLASQALPHCPSRNHSAAGSRAVPEVVSDTLTPRVGEKRGVPRCKKGQASLEILHLM